MKITFEIQDAKHQQDEFDDLHAEDKIALIKSAISDGFRVPEEFINVLEVKK